MTTQPFFSIVIPALNEEKHLPLLLKDLTKQSFTDFEVIVVDAHSDDRTVAKANQFLGKLRLQVIVSEKRNVSFQRNTGKKLAQGKWIVFMDADNRLPPYFLLGTKYQLEKNADTDIFTTWLDSSAYPSQHQPIIDLYNLALEVMSGIKPMSGGSMILVEREKSSSFWFNEKLTLSEDHDFIEQAVKEGLQFRCFKEPTYFTSLRRLEKEGSLKMLTTLAKVNLKNLTGQKITDQVDGYPMLGGSYYATESSKMPQSLKKFLNTLSKKQLFQIKQLIQFIQDNL